jgi:hypothetical protein
MFSWRNDLSFSYLLTIKLSPETGFAAEGVHKMRDEMDGRLWVEHHEEFSKGIDQLIARLKSAFASLRPALEHIHSFEWDAPWQRRGAGQA